MCMRPYGFDCVHLCVYYMCMCMYVCITYMHTYAARRNEFEFVCALDYINMYVHMYAYLCMCVYLCGCV